MKAAFVKSYQVIGQSVGRLDDIIRTWRCLGNGDDHLAFVIIDILHRYTVSAATLDASKGDDDQIVARWTGPDSGRDRLIGQSSA